MGSQNVIDYRKRRKLNLVKLSGEKCNVCGYNKCINALEFHHINPEEKEFGLGNGNCRKLETDLKELKKCILVCANCHREIEAGYYTKEELYKIRIYDEEFEKILIKEKEQLIEKTIYYCQECGKIITAHTKSNLCSDCFSKTQRKCERPDRDTLKNLIRTLPFTTIGEQYGVCDNSIRKWCKKYNLPFTKKEINSYTEDQWKKM